MSPDPTGVTESVETIRDAAGSRHLVEIDYYKPGQRAAGRRLVEPYRFEKAADRLLIHCYQVRPEPLGDSSWRTFRVDRIAGARDAGEAFEPRIEITLPSGEIETFVFGYRPTRDQTPAQRYFTFLEKNLLSGDIDTPAVEADARLLAKGLDAGTLRTAHARLYRDVLDELLIDGAISEADERHLRETSRLLERLGWGPG